MKKLLLMILSLFLVTSVSALEIQITIPAAIEQDTIEAFAQAYHYQEEIEQEEELVPNPQSKEDFMIEQIARFPQEVYIAHMSKEAGEIKQARMILAKENAGKITAEKIKEVE